MPNLQRCQKPCGRNSMLRNTRNQWDVGGAYHSNNQVRGIFKAQRLSGPSFHSASGVSPAKPSANASSLSADSNFSAFVPNTSPPKISETVGSRSAKDSNLFTQLTILSVRPWLTIVSFVTVTPVGGLSRGPIEIRFLRFKGKSHATIRVLYPHHHACQRSRWTLRICRLTYTREGAAEID